MTTVFFIAFFLVSAVVSTASALIVDACRSSVSSPQGVLFSCPARDGESLSNVAVIDLIVRDVNSTPIPGVPATDVWLIGCPQSLILCGGSGAINATAPTDLNGHTTVTGRFATSGCATGVNVVVQGLVIRGVSCSGGGCLPVAIRSADVIGPNNGAPDLVVNMLDLARIAQDYPSPPLAYNAFFDFAQPFGTVTLQDFARWAPHASHVCA